MPKQCYNNNPTKLKVNDRRTFANIDLELYLVALKMAYSGYLVKYFEIYN